MTCRWKPSGSNVIKDFAITQSNDSARVCGYFVLVGDEHHGATFAVQPSEHGENVGR
jgi:hypothetical protein